jgi:ATP-binding cassette subfamily B protein
MRRSGGRSWIVPEVVQTSAMDCGPASLKAVLEGFGISAAYGRLREACHTDVDGTSIDTLAEIASQLGLDAEQIMIPADHLLLPSASALPALAVVRLPNGFAHFVVIWRTHGPFVQIMDPATGRRWSTRQRLLDDLLIHSHPVPAAGWREWAGSDEAVAPLRDRLQALGAARAGERLVASALDEDGWRPLAALDAAVRMVTAMVRTGAIARGDEAAGVLASILESPEGPEAIVPESYWSVRPTEDSPDTLELRGAVLIRFHGRGATVDDSVEEASEVAPPELAAALTEPPPRPGRNLLRMLLADGALAPATLLLALLTAAGGVVVEALLLRALIDLGVQLGVSDQRALAMLGIVALLVLLVLLDLPIAATALRAGRRLEARLRIAFQEKIPRLGDRYFRSRLSSDMAERAHSVHTLSHVPTLASRFVRTVLVLCCTAGGIIWLDPRSAPVALVVAALSVALPLAAQSLIVERDLRVRTHGAALTRFYLDALLGLVAVRCHTAERAVQREHEGLLVEWARSGLQLLRSAVVVEGVLGLSGLCLVIWLLTDHLSRLGESGMILLLLYWALELPALGRQVALIARQYPAQRNVTLRLLEPLGAPEDEVATTDSAHAPEHTSTAPVAIELQQVSVKAAGATILQELDLHLAPGSHVAVVGRSGAGKSSLLALLLGLYRPASGVLTVDGELLLGDALRRLRAATAWLDPSVQLWNRSLLENLRYGNEEASSEQLAETLELAGLYGVLQRLPEGLQTDLGESGALLSGGEGQRVRLGRALLRSPTRLALMDEPFRGLDRRQRQALLATARAQWQSATLVCVTHDIAETESFSHVVVMDGGRVVEQGAPRDLLGDPRSHYRRLHDAEGEVRAALWDDPIWRRWHLADGRLTTEQTR